MAVTDEAILRIKEMIVASELTAGSKLPPEKELAERLGLSRSSLREAVKALAVIRVLDVRQGDGTYVTSLEPRLLLEAMSFVVDLHENDSVLELFAVRRILEPAASRLAARHATPQMIESLRVLVGTIDDVDDVETLVQHDLGFHRGIADATGNRYLASLIESLSSQTARARIWRGITEQNAVERTLHEHSAILGAIAAGDEQLAEALTLVHVSGVEEWLKSAI
ncbi:DNA-binding FadR family transcriptional regulator [Microbacterium halimionae]|uniref:DNA-binding FadR family transcriptional regulator n=1 Tax=Microbacterium halimionae TaxID=1526413 RepID=A0A7W3JQH7_9MICO|nr:FadR/GntR family transcriptional regulator [Microbacterium halimionae]MBA8817172.1 DNA-binding FadR family transcriptional regulator [Microbacterium halimionae]NII94622.1 DNA-binding FadR family transcriptional regulator [Microbacterium halimionae]